jgi:hypothetical protein
MLLAASVPYLTATEQDIDAAISILSSDKVAVICAGWKRPSAIEEVLLECDERFLNQETGLGGTAHSLNAALADWSVRRLGEWKGNMATLHQLFRKQLAAMPKRSKPQRTPMKDEEILSYIREASNRVGGISRSTLLRELRASGRACEQERFRQLFNALDAGVDS